MSEDQDGLIVETQERLEVIKRRAEVDGALAILKGAMGSTEPVDKASNALLLLAGAATTLVVSNSSSVIDVLGAGTFKVFIFVLLGSAILGFGSKISYLICKASLGYFDRLTTGVDEVFDSFTEDLEQTLDGLSSDQKSKLERYYPDQQQVMVYLFEAVPTWIAKPKDSLPEDNDGAILAYFQFPVWCFYLQIMFFLFQVLLTLTAFVVVGFGVE